jgi:Flp pilus assembly protein TadG
MTWLEKVRISIGHLLGAVARSQRGAVIILWALAAVPVVIGVGAAIDLSRAYMARSRLAFALDAAGLAAGAAGETEAEMRTIAEQYFFANYPPNQPGTPATPVLTIDGGVIKVTSSVTLEATLLRLIGQEDFVVAAAAEVLRKGLEVALVLDNTGSMRTNDKIGALRTASQDLINILFANPELSSKLSVGIVPYAGTVNLGAAALSIVSGVTADEFSTTDQEKWKGCVLARNYPDDVRDTLSGGGAIWSKAFWPSEPPSSSSNTWPPASTVFVNNANDVTGPNRACPTAVTPLTKDKDILDAAVDAMRAWRGGGTFSNVGMAWGWRVLSPEAPYTNALPYETPGFDKVAILMTDGRNNYAGNDYAAYEYLSQGNLGTTNNNVANSVLNNRLAEVCTNMKAAGIIIYTITFQLTNETTKTFYRNCASEPDKYFDSGNNAALQATFHDIAEQLINLRVTK